MYEISPAEIRKKKELENEVASLEKENDMTRKNMVGIEQEMKQLQDRIMEIGGIRLRSQKAKVDNIQDQLNTIHDSIANADVLKIKKEKDKARFEKAISDSRKELQEIEMQVSDVKNNIAKKTKLIDTLSARIKKIKQEINDKADELSVIKSRQNEEIKVNNSAREKEVYILIN